MLTTDSSDFLMVQAIQVRFLQFVRRHMIKSRQRSLVTFLAYNSVEVSLWATKFRTLTFKHQNNQLACLRWLCHFQIPQIIPLDDTISYHDIAIAANIPESDLRSIARIAMLINFLREPIQGQVGHSNSSASFVRSPILMELAKCFTNRSAPMATKMVESTVLLGSSKRGHSGRKHWWQSMYVFRCMIGDPSIENIQPAATELKRMPQGTQ